MDVPGPIDRYARNSPLVARLCTQNGWIDEDTFDFELREYSGDRALLVVRFEEIVVKAAGCVGRRIPCFGMIRLNLSPDGEVIGAQLL